METDKPLMTINLAHAPEETTYDFHPKAFEEYIGQKELKTKLQLYCHAARLRAEPMDHLLLFGPPGLGKTTLALIMAQVMNVNIKICNGPMLERTGDMVSLLSSLEPREILFIDEIHRMPTAVEEVLYNAMEHFRVDVIVGQGPGAKSINLPIHPFTLIGATTKSGMISAPLQSRFGINERLDYYSDDDLQAIILQSAHFLQLQLSAESALMIARCARGTPRIAKKLVRRVRDFAQIHNKNHATDMLVQESLHFLGIDKEGLTLLDHKIIAALVENNGGPVGLETLACLVGEDSQTLEEVYEPFLIRKGFIERTPRGRQIPQKKIHRTHAGTIWANEPYVTPCASHYEVPQVRSRCTYEVVDGCEEKAYYISMIHIIKACLTFGTRKIFDELTATFQEDDRVGLVGRNGYGKSTLLKVIAQQQDLDSGSVSIIGGKRIAYLSQEIVLNSEKPVLEHVIDGARDVLDLLYHSEAELRGQADKILRGLGLSEKMLTLPVNTLSGGWKMRVLLAQLLVQKADFYLFDEPTNHLDIVAKDWFLHFLMRADFGFLIVCHEKYFLNKLCKKILALDTPGGKFYQGNYDAYVARFESDAEALEAAYVQQQKMIKQKKDTIARFGASAARSSQAQSMKKELEKLTLIVPPAKKATMHIPLPAIKPSGHTVLTAHNISARYDDNPDIFSGLEFSLKRHEKIAIVAANGVGKTTLLHTIAGTVAHHTGSLEVGNQVTTSLFHQEQSKILHAELSVWEEVSHNTNGIVYSDAQIRTMLGCFLFSNDDIHKKIGVLSGGEKSRVGMIKVLLQQANFLLLDEPTNHLDIPSKDILLKTLKEYTGTLLFVSHDHDFVNELATSILELTPTRALIYPGNYESYKEQKEYQEKQSDGSASAGSASAGSLLPASASSKPAVKVASFYEQKQLRKVEQAIDRITKERIKLTAELEQYAYGTPEFKTRYDRLQKIDAEEPKLLAQWDALQ